MSPKDILRLSFVGLTIALFAFAMSCGGGGGSRISSSTLSAVNTGDRAVPSAPMYEEGMIITEEDLPNISPTLRELINHPALNGPATPVPPLPPISFPQPIDPESFSKGFGGETITGEDIPRRVSYDEIDVPDTAFPADAGEYDPSVYDNNPATETPPWGWDAMENSGNGNGLEDRIERVDPLLLLDLKGRSYTWLGRTRKNFYARGYADSGNDPRLAAVYQTFIDTSGIGERTEIGYRADQTSQAGAEFQTGAYAIKGAFFDLWQSFASATLKAAEEPVGTQYHWYDIMIAPMSNESGPYMSEYPGYETSAKVQWFSKDTTDNSPLKVPLNNPNKPRNFPKYADSLMVMLLNSKNKDIQKIIDERTDLPWNPSDPTQEPPPSNYAGVFPVFGAIAQRWADDTFLIGDVNTAPPWSGRLGFPVTPPMMLNDGQRIQGPDGVQYHEIEQWFEGGIVRWLKAAPGWENPDSVVIWTFKNGKFTWKPKPDDLIQDPKIVRYGTGRALGVVAWVWPREVNIGEPVYLKAFPFGGPAENDFADDFFLWRLRDGTYVVGSEAVVPVQFFIKNTFEQPAPTPYDYMASYVARVMLILDVNGDGIPDGTDPNNVAVGDTDEFVVGIKGTGGGGGGAKLLMVNMDSSGQNWNKWIGDLDAEGIRYDTIQAADLTDADLANYLVAILVPRPIPTVWASTDWTTGIRDKFMNYVKTGVGTGIVWSRDWWFGVGGFAGQTWRDTFGGIGGLWGWYCISCGNHLTTGSPLASGPGGNFTIWQFQYSEHFLNCPFQPPPFQFTKLLYAEFGGGWAPMAACHDPGWNGKKGIGFGGDINYFQGTQPPSGGTGTSKAILNLLNYADPAVLEGGGGGGTAPAFAKYTGPVQVGDPAVPKWGVFAYVIRPGANNAPSMVQGGDGSDAFDDPHPRTASVSIITSPATIEFECLAHGDPDADGEDMLGYEWQFYPDWMYEPGGPKEGEPKWEEWPRYTSHTYDGGVDPDGDAGPAAIGDPFPVKVRVWDADNYATFDEAFAAGTDYWAEGYVYIRVAGVLPVDITDNGTTFDPMYPPDQNGDVTVELKWTVSGGQPGGLDPEGGNIPPGYKSDGVTWDPAYYDDFDIDWDYDYATYDEMVEVYDDAGFRPQEGPMVYSLVMEDPAPGKTYTIAVRVVDPEAPNGEDMYVWDNAVFVASPIAIVNDGGTSNYNAIKTDLQALGLGFVELNSSQITSSSQLDQYKFVIWACSPSYYQFSSSERNIIKDYIKNKGGNFFLPYNYWEYDSWSPFDSEFNSMLGCRYYFGWYAQYFSVPSSSQDGKQHVWRSGYPGSDGQYVVSLVYGSVYSFITDVYYYYRAYYTPGSPLPMCGEYGWDPWYEDGGMNHNSNVTGENWGAWFGYQWDYLPASGTTNNASVQRRHLLGRILKKMDPTVL